jgi:hypothetical protein
MSVIAETTAPNPETLDPLSRPARAETRRLGPLLAFAVHEPFFQFLVLGLAIWCGVEYLQAHNQRYVITIGPAQEQRLAIAYQQQFQQAPTPDQLASLVDHYIREEIFLREGLALNLDREDEIVRRRIAQKFEFLQTDLGVPDPPSPAELERWFAQNRQRYLNPKAVTFTQVYVSPDKGGDQAAHDRAIALLARLRATQATRAVDLGDAFPGPSDLNGLIPAEAARVFGESEFSEKLFAAPEGEWAGPFRSGYGWHLVYVTDVQPESLPTLAAVHDRVLADYLEERRQALNAETFERIKAKYTVRRGVP